MIETEFINLKEVATTLGVCSKTAKKILLNAKGLNYTRAGRQILVNKQHLLEYMNNTNTIMY